MKSMAAGFRHRRSGQLSTFYSSPTGQKMLMLTQTVLAEDRAGIKDVMHRHFTTSELRDIQRFAESSLGHRVQDPRLQTEMRVVANRYLQPILDRVVSKYTQEIKAAVGQ
jgi:hypothetical protein